eukprot:6152737-Alexandrium_andersonii.AAC.1
MSGAARVDRRQLQVLPRSRRMLLTAGPVRNMAGLSSWAEQPAVLTGSRPDKHAGGNGTRSSGLCMAGALRAGTD